MDAIALNSEEQGYGFDHPVMWLDADLVFMTKGTPDKIAAEVRNFDALIVHANTQYAIDWAEGRPLQELDDATKAVAVNEIQRRQIARQREASDIYSSYPEESGFAFALGTYLKAEGLNTYEPINEAEHLVRHIRQAEIDARFGRGEAFVPPFLRPSDQPPELGTYIDSARMGISARHYAAVNKNGIGALVDADRAGYGWMFSAMKDATARTAGNVAIDPDELREVLAINETRLRSKKPEDVTRSTTRQRVLSNIIDRYFRAS